mgnify:CR=1 FL=1
MNIHFLEEHFYTKKFVDYVNQNYSIDTNRFYIFGKPQGIISSCENVFYIEDNGMKQINKIKEIINSSSSNKIFLHYLSTNNQKVALFSSKINKMML